MKKLLIILLSFAATSPAWAEHFFNVCYYNTSKAAVSYNNDGIHHLWKHIDTLTGSGTVDPQQNKCFTTADETIFRSHYITFYVNNKWYGIVNPGFSRPYAIAQDATAKKGTNISHQIDAGHDEYNLNVLITDDGVILSGVSDPKNTDAVITPAVFTK